MLGPFYFIFLTLDLQLSLCSGAAFEVPIYLFLTLIAFLYNFAVVMGASQIIQSLIV